MVQVLSKEGAERWGEQNFGYTADREKLTVNWIRVLSLDGKVIADGPTHEQESLAPVALESPVYSDSKIRRVTIGGIAPGTLLDFSWTIEQFKPVLPGDLYSGWRVTTGRAGAAVTVHRGRARAAHPAPARGELALPAPRNDPCWASHLRVGDQ